MGNLNLRKLKLLAGVLVVLLVLAVSFLVAMSYNPQEIFEEPVSVIVNNNQKVVHHSGDIYCYTNLSKNGGRSKCLFRLPIDFGSQDTREVIMQLSPVDENIKLEFYNNRLFFLHENTTYMYNVLNNRVDKFCDGELQFLCEGNSFVTLYNFELHKGEFYPDTYLAKKYSKIATGQYRRYDEDDDRVYYASNAGTSNTIVVALNKKTLNVVLIDNFERKNSTLEDVLVTDSFVYEQIRSAEDEVYIRKVSKNEKKKDEKVEYQILPLERKAQFVEFIDPNYARALSGSNVKAKMDDLYFYVGDVVEGEVEGSHMLENKVVNKQIYKYDASKNKVSLYKGVFNELWLENYTLKAIGSTVSLFYRNELLTNIDVSINGIKELEMMSVDIIGDYLYYEFSAFDGVNTEVVFARTVKNSVKVDEERKSERIN